MKPESGNAGDSEGTLRLKTFFDAEYYLTNNPDVAASGLAPLAHFREVGHAQGRIPSPELGHLAPVLKRRAQVSATPFADIVELLPRGRRKQVLRPAFWDLLRSSVHPEFYAAQLEEPVVRSVEETLEHYLTEGVFQGMRVGLLFHPEWYARQVERETGEPIPADCHPFFHWLTIGHQQRWVSTPLFDTDYYLSRHPDMRRFRGWLFMHFLQHGAFERGRRASSFVQPTSTEYPKAKEDRRPFLLDQVLEGATPQELSRSSPLEERTLTVLRKVERLERPTMQEMIAKAADIEPLIHRPYGGRDVNWPPLLNSAVRLRDAVEAARDRIGVSHVDTLVFVPHCRMAGSARVTGALVKAVADLAPNESLLVVTTDLPAFDRPDWFPPGVRVVDTSSLAEGLTEEYKTRLLLDVVRGLQPRRVINVNSRRCWELYRMFARQLRTMSELYAYLFTWDLDERGNKGGYPITYFQQCLDSLDRVLIDSEALRDELVWRYALSKPLRDRLRVLHTPADYASAIDHSAIFETRRSEGRRLRAFWSGRFDRQKRFDVVVEIARKMPELEIWAWGKAVLGGAGVDFDSLPSNIQLQGTYHDFEDLPVEACDFFLYTSEWDGLPTILIDAGARGVATVGSQVGGVRDILTEATGFPVTSALDATAYTNAIKRMLADPAEVTRRATAFRALVRDVCDSRRYATDLGASVGLTDPSTAYAEPDPVVAKEGPE